MRLRQLNLIRRPPVLAGLLFAWEVTLSFLPALLVSVPRLVGVCTASERKKKPAPVSH